MAGNAASSSSSALTRTETSLRGQRVLEEDSYMSSLSSLIQRDFFPALPRLKAENEYLEALQALDEGENDEEGQARLRRAERVLDELDEADAVQREGRRRRSRRGSGRGASATPSLVMGRMATPMDTPAQPLNRGWDPTPIAGSSTPRPPQTHDGDPTTSPPPPLIDVSSHTISSFQRAYTSEDNASFLSLLHATNVRRRQKYAKAFAREDEINARRTFVHDEARKRADEGYARSVLALPEGKRRKLIEAGKVDEGVKERVGELEKLRLYEGKEGKLLTAAQQEDDRPRVLIRSASEELPEVEEDDARNDIAVIARPRSVSPPTDLKPLKHSLDPRSEISIPLHLYPDAPLSSAQRSLLLSRPDEDPTNILGRAPVLPTASNGAAGWKYRLRNALFYGPDADISTVDKASSSLPLPGSSSDDQSKKGPKLSAAERLFHARQSLQSQTNFHNTALPSQELFPQNKYPGLSSSQKRKGSSSGSTIASTPRSSRIESAIAGGSRYGDRFDEDGQKIEAGPMVNGYGFVTPHRSPAPSEAGGETPGGGASSSSRKRLLSMHASSRGSKTGDDGEGRRPGFAVPATPRRDEIAHRLARGSTSSSGRRAGSSSSSSSSSSRPASKRADMLSPAAKSLLSRSTTTATPRGLSGSSAAGSGKSSTGKQSTSIGGRGTATSSSTSMSYAGGIGKRGWEEEATPAPARVKRRDA